MKKSILLSLLMLFALVSANAQSSGVEMADGLYANGKIYVVATVASIVVTILLVYVISIDRKVSKLEEKVNKK
ncbi:MAG: CcmD family protein [Bacteroidota bacterium]